MLGRPGRSALAEIEVLRSFRNLIAHFAIFDSPGVGLA